jgi:hypothetical protein
MAKPRQNLNKTTKECPAPEFQAPMLLLTPFSTHLSFRWTLPLSYFFSASVIWFLFFAAIKLLFEFAFAKGL